MHLRNKPPVFVPREHRAEFEALSKAALMDMVWDYAERCAEEKEMSAIMAEFRKARDIVLTHRRFEVTAAGCSTGDRGR
jgi:hypothetical protein